MHHKYVHTLGTKCLTPKAAINVVITPSHQITAINMRVDAVTREERQANLTWMLGHPYAFLPTENLRVHRRLPKNV